MKTALVVLAAVMLLVGCGGCAHTPPVAAPSSPVADQDPFVGTWATSFRPDVKVVISKRGSSYVAVVSKNGRTQLRLVFSRHANRLVAEEAPPVFGTNMPIADVYPATKEMYFSPFGLNEQLSKVSDSTAIPTASP